jgi:hypothetical protein
MLRPRVKRLSALSLGCRQQRQVQALAGNKCSNTLASGIPRRQLKLTCVPLVATMPDSLVDSVFPGSLVPVMPCGRRGECRR